MTRNTEVHVYFKLFNTIKSEHEAEDLARLEIEALFGESQSIQNFVDTFMEEPMAKLINARFASNTAEVRIQDVMTYELPYGRIQGYHGTRDEYFDATQLVRRLGYTKEMLIVGPEKLPNDLLQEIFPDGTLGANIQITSANDWSAVRLITNQYFLEKSMYISKLSRNEEEIDKNVEALLSFPCSQVYRVPASESMSIGKRLEDYFGKREELSLYLNHYMHPYKGKFHPRMARTLLNCVLPGGDGEALDNFAGSGTLLLEASFMGINSVGYEINPLSALMTNVKCSSYFLDAEELRERIRSFLEKVSDAFSVYNLKKKGQSTITQTDDFSFVEEEREKLPKKVVNGFRNGANSVDHVSIAKSIIDTTEDSNLKGFLLLALSGSISDASRRTSADFLDVMRSRLYDLYRRIYLFHKLNEVLKIPLGSGLCHVGDTRDMNRIPDGSIGAIVNSPPYSTALDYIKNDEPQLHMLGLVSSFDNLGENMIGNPRKTPKYKELRDIFESEGEEFETLPEYARKIVKTLMDGGRVDAGLRCFKFFLDMSLSLEEMYRVLRPGGKCAIVIGNNHFKVGNHFLEIRNDDVVRRVGQGIGFSLDCRIERELEKTSRGNIRYESIVILKK